jgi:alpha-L-arabinofuranosidase
MVNAPEYRWKKMIGPRDKRPPYKGTWYPYSSNGWGIFDFLDFCEAAGFLAIPDVNIDESPEDMADFIEYVNADAEVGWGMRRAENGRIKPYGLKYLELGNEEAVDEAYWQKFKAIADAVWAKDQSIVLVVGDFAYGEHIKDPLQFDGAPRIKSLAAHQKILDFAKSKGRPVWFDIHIWNDKPGDALKQIQIAGEFSDWLGKLAPGAEFKVCVFEENANNHLMRRALAHAETINGLEQLGDRFPIVCCANALQPDGQNDNGWDQGLLFLNPERVWAQAPYYVTQMASQSYLPKCLEVRMAQKFEKELDVAAFREDRNASLQVVNVGNRRIRTRFVLEGFGATFKECRATQISGELEDRNSAEDPDRVVPWHRDVEVKENVFWFDLAPHSFTTFRLQ